VAEQLQAMLLCLLLPDHAVDADSPSAAAAVGVAAAAALADALL
jgi:hypothetical protein